MQWIEELNLAKHLARQAGALVLEQAGKVDRLTKTHAATTDEAVTEADRASQRLIVAGIREVFPNDGLIGEENDTGSAITAEIHDPLGRNWVIDPIDGTNNFVAGFGGFAVCIGLLFAGSPVMGVVYDVTRDELYFAANGMGAWKNEQRLHALHTPLSERSLLMVTNNLLDASGMCPPWGIRWIRQTTWKLRMLGSAALEAVQVAAGVAHGAVTIQGKLWDAVAPAAIVIESGASITKLNGDAIFPFDVEGYAGAKVPFLAAGPGAKAELIRELKGEG